MDDMMDETSEGFLKLTEQLYISFLLDFPSRSAVVYETTKWDNYIFTYDHGNKIDVTRHRRSPIAMDKWQFALNPSCGVYVTSDMRSGAFKEFYLHLIWPSVYRSPVHTRPKPEILEMPKISTPERIPPHSVEIQGRLFEI